MSPNWRGCRPACCSPSSLEASRLRPQLSGSQARRHCSRPFGRFAVRSPHCVRQNPSASPAAASLRHVPASCPNIARNKCRVLRSPQSFGQEGAIEFFFDHANLACWRGNEPVIRGLAPFLMKERASEPSCELSSTSARCPRCQTVYGHPERAGKDRRGSVAFPCRILPRKFCVLARKRAGHPASCSIF